MMMVKMILMRTDSCFVHIFQHIFLTAHFFPDPWTGSDRDYQYDELLQVKIVMMMMIGIIMVMIMMILFQRVFGIMRDKNPEMVGGDRKKFVMRPPQVSDNLGHTGSSRVILGHLGSTWVILGHLGSSWVILGHLGSSWVILGHPGSSWVILWSHRSIRKV